jgi:energy-coupling factor transporter transmembrane protein EcfT
LLRNNPEEPSNWTAKFIAFLTTARHVFLSSARFTPRPSHPSWRYVLILFFCLLRGLPSVVIPTKFPTKTLFASLPYVPCAWPISSFLIWSPV